MLVSNTDDHLRNHGFILTPKGWTLSPLYDVNPVPYGHELSLGITDSDNRISAPLALETAHYYGIGKDVAQTMFGDTAKTVAASWKKTAKYYRIGAASLQTMRPAFTLAEEYSV